jgi:hypothetical protein
VHLIHEESQTASYCHIIIFRHYNETSFQLPFVFSRNEKFTLTSDGVKVVKDTIWRFFTSLSDCIYSVDNVYKQLIFGRRCSVQI